MTILNMHLFVGCKILTHVIGFLTETHIYAVVTPYMSRLNAHLHSADSAVVGWILLMHTNATRFSTYPWLHVHGWEKKTTTQLCIHFIAFYAKQSYINSSQKDLRLFIFSAHMKKINHLFPNTIPSIYILDAYILHVSR